MLHAGDSRSQERARLGTALAELNEGPCAPGQVYRQEDLGEPTRINPRDRQIRTELVVALRKRCVPVWVPSADGASGQWQMHTLTLRTYGFPRDPNRPDLVERFAVNPNLFRYRNRGDARFHGVEIVAGVALARGFGIEAAAQASQGRDGIDATPLDDVAPASISAIARHRAGARVSSYVRVAAYRAHDDAGPSEVPVPGYALADAGASWRLSPRLTLHAVARNLFDERYYASAGPRWVHAPGRQGVVTISVGF